MKSDKIIKVLYEAVDCINICKKMSHTKRKLFGKPMKWKGLLMKLQIKTQ